MRFLITGGTGTFGSALVEKLLKNGNDEIIVFSRDEYKQYLMREKYKTDKLKFVIGDIRNIDSLNACMKNVDYVFHAAAMKHVRICEENPQEAILTNVIGTQNVLKSAIEYDVKKVVILSTDKAVCPQNTLGLTKALAEKLALSFVPTSKTKIFITRFGNLMMSRGSVLEKFVDLAKQGMSLTVTSPNMERFMMTIEDAINLILFAFSSDNSGHIFIKKSKVFNILMVAQVINDLYKNKAPIEIIPSINGEKEIEALVYNEKVIEHDDYYEIDPNNTIGEMKTILSTDYLKESPESIKNILQDLLEMKHN